MSAVDVGAATRKGWDGKAQASDLIAMLESVAGPKELFVVDGATHMDLYDGAGLGIAMNKLSPFFNSSL